MRTHLQSNLFRILTVSVISCAMLWPSSHIAYANVSYSVTLSDGSISPAFLTARRDESVSIHVTNRGTKPHNLVIKDFYVFTQNLGPGEDVQVSFKPDKTGTFAYYSDTGGKPESGMQGQIVVS